MTEQVFSKRIISVLFLWKCWIRYLFSFF